MRARALILVHGRGGSGEQMRAWLLEHMALPPELEVRAPQAPGGTWYPTRFIEPKAANEPHLSNALAVLEGVVRELDESDRISPEQVLFFGFSQGACLVSEYLKQDPRRYGGAIIASGGVIGSDEEALAPGGAGSLAETPVYLGCDRADAHIPESRVLTTEQILEKLGADVDMRLYEDLGHTVHPDALTFLSARF